MKVGLGADHAGYILKEKLINHLNNAGIETVDYGTNSADRTDYPDYALKVSKGVINNEVDYGVLICGTGIGMSIAANKVKGIRAALAYNELTAKLAKEHNHANVITLGARTNTADEAKRILDTFLEAVIEERHQNRIDKITEIEENNLEWVK